MQQPELRSQMVEYYCDPAHIVLVDELDSIRNVMKKQLEQKSYKVTGLASSAELVQHFTDLIQKGCTALPIVIIENRTTVSDAITAAKLIKHMCPCVKVILCTPDHVTPRTANAVDCVLMKPVTTHDIEEAVFSVIDVLC
jgi:DNA-binding NtrC family response regulator